MRNVAFTNNAFQEYNHWLIIDIKLIARIQELIKDIDRNPFKGIGKPEPLKGNWSGYWSRRIDDKHRLVSKVSETQILIVKCSGHY